MLFIVTQITKDKDGTVAPATFTFNTIKEAKANYHYFLTSCYGNDNLVFFMAGIRDQFGNQICDENYSE